MSQGWRGGWRGGGGGNPYAGAWRGRPWRGRGQGGTWSRNNGRDPVCFAPPKPQLTQTTLDKYIPYKGWKLYFSEAYSDNSPFLEKVRAFEKFFKKQIELYDKDEIERKGSILVDYKELLQDEDLSVSIPLSSELKDMPEKILECMGLAIHQVLTKDLETHAADLQQQEGLRTEEAPIVNVPFIHARVFNYDTLTSLKNLRASLYGKYVALRGTVVRVGNIKPLCTKMAFSCNMCGDIQCFPLPDGKYTVPTKCPVPECRGRSFTANRSSPLTVTVDWQTIKVQELMSDDQREAGRIPRTVECELIQDLVDSCVPGDMITVTGIVKVSNTRDGGFKNKNNKCMFLLYIEANSVSNSKGQKGKSTEDSGNHGASMDFSLKDLYAIQEIQSQENLFQLIVNSLCPTIYGHELVKAGLSLALFGGCQKYADDKNRIPIRGDPHILVVGDPGLGKSQMLQAVCNVAPRGVYVCGNTTTTSGLTVTLSRDTTTGDFGLEAGALVLGDQGICGIDEFDKMGNQHQALLEAMEQQSISLAKAGIVCSLPARTSIIAAANPVGGHYNKGKTVSENLKMGSALLSRFDLVFILVDTPNEDHDHLLSEHVMAMRSGAKEIQSVDITRINTQNSNTSILEVPSERPLGERLKLRTGEHFDALPHQLLRKFVGYARQYVHPSLSPDAAQILQDFYLELRKQNQGIDSTPITTRQLESLIRLTEARARLELREKATKEDAEEVVQIMKYSLLGTFSDEFGKLDFQRSQHGSGMSNRSKAKKFVSALNKVAEQTYNNLFEFQQLRQIARELQIQVIDFEAFIGSLNDQGYLLKKGPRVFQLQTM
ncbi:DNA helicase MCM8 isoform X1 [Xenopus laevis]|uniref:DNA helicase MCM8 n=1 Tax=Xenopus laevis TaxID=8355 RepID=A0A8J1KLP5_XENLA|nr:DNA helicase MCM8 isoform X1 [Xenopus laevis]